MFKKILSKWYLFIIFGFIVFAALVYGLLGENSVIAVHDNLDLFVPQYKMMKDTGTFFAHNAPVPFLANISRDYLPSELNLYTMVFMVLPEYWAYITCYFIKIFIAIFGSVCFAKAVLRDSYENYTPLVWMAGFAYGILNLFPNFGIAFASIPLLLFIMNRIVNHPRKIGWYALLFIYPFVSYFSYLGIFFIGYMCIYFVYRWIKTKRFPLSIMFSIIILSLGYACFEYRLFYEMLFSDTVSIRTTMVQASLNFDEILKMIWEGLWTGDMHTESVHRFFILPLCAVFLIIQNFIYIKNRQYKKIFTDNFNGVILFILLNALFYGLYYFEPLRNLFEMVFPPLKGFEFHRTEFVNPCLWYIALFIMTKRIYDYLPKVKWIANIMMVVSVLIIILSGDRYNDLYHTCYMQYCKIAHGAPSNDLTYKEYYSTKLFDKAKEDINYSGEWSVAYGFYPAVLEYNGIHTLDGYLGYYSQFYKDEFRRIIAPALDLVPESASYYDIWGARCYMYSGTYVSNTNAYRDYGYTDEDLYMDIDAFKDWGGQYIFSRVKLNNAAEAGFTLVNTYTDAESPYTLYLYRTTSRFMDKEHINTPYSERTNLTYDYDKTLGLLDRMNELVALNGDKDELSDEERKEFEALYDEIIADYDNIATCYQLAILKSESDINDDAIGDKVEAIYTDYIDLNDNMLQALRGAAQSSYEDVLKDIMLSESLVEEFKEYEDMTKEEQERAIKIQSLKDDYRLQAYDEYTYELDGITWNEESADEAYMAGDLDINDYLDITCGIYRNKAAVLGEIYKEELLINNEMAKEEGYDNFLEYAYENVYVRDYTVDDILALCDEVKKNGKKYVRSIMDQYSDIMEYDPGYITVDDTATFNMLLPYFARIDTSMQESLEHMLECDLYDMNVDPNKSDRGFTVGLNSYGDAFIFDSPYESSQDLLTYIHEFGHYNQMYHIVEDDFSNFANKDTSEIHSQGLEVLMLKYFPEMLGEETGKYMECLDIYELTCAIYQACMYAEFEIYAYENPDATVEELGNKMYEIYKDYGYNPETIDKRMDYWVDVTHFFESPGYYISYATSALAALDIYTMSLENYDIACEKYLELISLRSYWCYRETLDYVGIPDIFDKGVTTQILHDTSKIYKEMASSL